LAGGNIDKFKNFFLHVKKAFIILIVFISGAYWSTKIQSFLFR